MNLPRIALLLILISLSCFAYDPAVATAGSVTVRLPTPALGSYGAGGLAEFRQAGVPVTVMIEISNAGASEVRGTARLRVIDRWQTQPDTAVPFSLTGRSHVALPFAVSFGAGTHNAWYPIHADVEFEEAGRKMSVHPVLVVRVEQADPPLARPAPDRSPFVVAPNSMLALWRIPLHREEVRITQETSTGGAYESAPVVAFQNGIVMTLGPRPPSRRETVSAASTEYSLSLPAGQSLHLRFSTSGAALFRVSVDGETLFDSQSAGSGDLDLRRWAGKTVTLRFAAEANDSTTSVVATWTEPTLFAGEVVAASVFPPGPSVASRSLGTVDGRDIRLWPGRRGLLDSALGFGSGGSLLLFHGFRVRVLGDNLDDPRAVSHLAGIKDESQGEMYRLRHQFRTWAGPLDLLIEVKIDRDALQAKIWLENAPPPQPWRQVYLEEVSLGPWSETARRVYGGPGNVIESPQAFRLNFDGHNLASSFVGFEFPRLAIVEASDVTPDRLVVDPGARIYTLAVPHSQTLTLIPAEDVWKGALAWRGRQTVRASAGVPKLAGRFVFDLWQGQYAESAALLAKAFQYGLTDSVVVWHNWQRWGYDYRLPDIYPPNPKFGTMDDFLQLVKVCRDNGVLFAPHDNYIDLYPDSDGFSYSRVAFVRDGQPQRAWFHYERLAQSYRARADAVQPLVEKNLKLIRDGFAPTAYFIDVWSSIAPYDYWTEDGLFVDRSVTRRVWGEAFAWIRGYLGDNAPQISEAGHDQLIGWLDGAQANQLRVDGSSTAGFVWRIKAGDAERIPWFDAVYHDRFVLHGAGYSDRYAGGLDQPNHGIYSNDYIATEALTGHPAMVADAFNRNVVRKYWLMHDLMRALAGRRVTGVEFEGGDIHRQVVRWDNGGVVRVDRGRFTFEAKVPVNGGVVEAGVTADGEYSRSPTADYRVSGGNGYRITRESGVLIVTPLPDSKAFTVAVGVKPKRVQAIDENGRVLREARPTSDDRVAVEPGVFAYRVE